MTGEKNRFTTTERLWDLDDKQLKSPMHDAMVLWLMDETNLKALLEKQCKNAKSIICSDKEYNINEVYDISLDIESEKPIMSSKTFIAGYADLIVDFKYNDKDINQFLLLLFSCLVVAFGVLLEIQTEVVYLPADGVIVAISKVLKKDFPKVKPFVDTSMVIIAAVLSIVFLGYLAGVREGTIISALIIGPIVKILKKYFDSPVSRLFEK